MALTGAERKRKSREKKRMEEKALPDEALRFVRSNFSNFLDQEKYQWNELNSIGEIMDSVGMYYPDLLKDEDLSWRPEWGIDNRGSLGLAERMVGVWIESAQILAELINTFKLQEVDRAMKKLSGSDLSDPEVKEQAFKDIVQLNVIKARLQKQVRHAFHATTVKGE